MLEVLDNKYVSTILTLIIVLYCSFIGPELPNAVKNLFKNTIFKMIVLFLVIVKGKTNPGLAIVIAVAFVITLDYIGADETVDTFASLKNQKKLTTQPKLTVQQQYNVSTGDIMNSMGYIKCFGPCRGKGSPECIPCLQNCAKNKCDKVDTFENTPKSDALINANYYGECVEYCAEKNEICKACTDSCITPGHKCTVIVN